MKNVSDESFWEQYPEPQRSRYRQAWVAYVVAATAGCEEDPGIRERRIPPVRKRLPHARPEDVLGAIDVPFREVR